MGLFIYPTPTPLEVVYDAFFHHARVGHPPLTVDDEPQLHEFQSSHLGPSSVRRALPVTLTYERLGQTPEEDVKAPLHRGPAVPASHPKWGKSAFLLFMFIYFFFFVRVNTDTDQISNYNRKNQHRHPVAVRTGLSRLDMVSHAR